MQRIELVSATSRETVLRRGIASVRSRTRPTSRAPLTTAVAAATPKITASVTQQTERVNHAISGTMERVDETAARLLNMGQLPSKDDLRDLIASTLLHEVGHYLGLDEDDLDERGLG